MSGKEAIFRVKTGNFNGDYGFDLQILIDAVGALGEMFRSGQITEVVRCKNCEQYLQEIHWCNNSMSPKAPTFFCADGKGREVE